MVDAREIFQDHVNHTQCWSFQLGSKDSFFSVCTTKLGEILQNALSYISFDNSMMAKAIYSITYQKSAHDIFSFLIEKTNVLYPFLKFLLNINIKSNFLETFNKKSKRPTGFQC